MKLEVFQGCPTVCTTLQASLQDREMRVSDVQCPQAAFSSFSSWIPEHSPWDDSGGEMLHWQEEAPREQQRNMACVGGLQGNKKMHTY